MQFPNHTDTLARTIYGEAEVGDIADAEAIASVVLNRVRHRQWPNEIDAVCRQPWQFSCWNPGNPRLHVLEDVGLDDWWFTICWHIAKKAVAGELEDNTDGATHYYATYIAPPRWAEGKTPCFETPYGKYNHLFFNDIDTPKPRTKAAAQVAGATAAVTGGAAAAHESGLLEQVQEVTGVVEPLVRIATNLGPNFVWFAAGLGGALAAYLAWSWWQDRKEGGRT